MRVLSDAVTARKAYHCRRHAPQIIAAGAGSPLLNAFARSHAAESFHANCSVPQVSRTKRETAGSELTPTVGDHRRVRRCDWREEEIGGPCRSRTYDQEIKSLLLYQLS